MIANQSGSERGARPCFSLLMSTGISNHMLLR
jgi:hypothetical protein